MEMSGEGVEGGRRGGWDKVRIGGLGREVGVREEGDVRGGDDRRKRRWW